VDPLHRRTPHTLARRRRIGMAAAVADVLGSSVSAVVLVQRQPPATVLATSVAELGALAALIATGSLAALVALVICSVALTAVAAMNERRILALTPRGDVVLRASRTGWPVAVAGPARAVELPAPRGLGVTVRLEDRYWWIDRSSFRLLRLARRAAEGRAAEEADAEKGAPEG